jgi:hypothetical protein
MCLWATAFVKELAAIGKKYSTRRFENVCFCVNNGSFAGSLVIADRVREKYQTFEFNNLA